MGYYTRYTLTTEKPEDDATIRAAIADLYEVSPFAEDGDFDFADHECKWYQWREHCLQVSRAHPSVTFTVVGHGESGTKWQSTWLDGGEVYVVLEQDGDWYCDEADASVDPASFIVPASPSRPAFVDIDTRPASPPTWGPSILEPFMRECQRDAWVSARELLDLKRPTEAEASEIVARMPLDLRRCGKTNMVIERYMKACDVLASGRDSPAPRRRWRPFR